MFSDGAVSRSPTVLLTLPLLWDSESLCNLSSSSLTSNLRDVARFSDGSSTDRDTTSASGDVEST